MDTLAVLRAAERRVLDPETLVRYSDWNSCTCGQLRSVGATDVQMWEIARALEPLAFGRSPKTIISNHTGQILLPMKEFRDDRVGILKTIREAIQVLEARAPADPHEKALVA